MRGEKQSQKRRHDRTKREEYRQMKMETDQGDNGFKSDEYSKHA